MTILITGSRGFVGTALLKRWQTQTSGLTGELVFSTQRMGADADFIDELQDVDVVVHLAARVHHMTDSAQDSLKEYRSVNVDGTRVLATQAADVGVKRFVYVSSVKVSGEATNDGHPFLETDVPAPQDAYGVSKWEAEQCLHALTATTDMEIVIIRPPLVYGPGVKANFANLIRAVARKVPLPFGAICNQRSLIYVENLVDFIDVCVVHPAAANQTFFVSDGRDLSTAELVHELAWALGVSERLLPVPASFLMFVGTILGKSDKMQRLCGNLQVDISKARNLLGWTPPFTVECGLRSIASVVA